MTKQAFDKLHTGLTEALAVVRGWNYDLTKAPTDGTHVILALPNKTTLRSYWCEPKNEPAHWCMLSHRNAPVAWMLWPEHPFAAATQGEAAATSAAMEIPSAGGGANAGGTDEVTGSNAHPQTQAVEPVSSSTAFYLEDVGSGA